MPRPKGSKNKSNALYASDERIMKCVEELEALQAKVKEKKLELKQLKTAKEKADKQKLMDVIMNSGMTPDEILTRLAIESPEEETDETPAEDQSNDQDVDTIDSDIIQ